MISSQTNIFRAFESAIARIYRPNEGVVGAGFLISHQYVLTCAHVVTSALKIATETPETPTQSIDVDFPLIAPGEKLKAKVVFWQPVQSVAATPAKQGEDIAVLEVEGELPKQAQPARIAPIEGEDLWEHSFRVFGFPSGHDTGVWATGVLSGKQALGWVQMEDVKGPGYQVEPGFSGAPVWDKNLANVVGIAVAAERKREGVKSAFMIPTKVLRGQIPVPFLSLPDRPISLPTVDERYQPIIRAFTLGDIVPFLGAGINLCDRPEAMTIELALRLAQVYNPQGQLLGLPCSVCPLSLEEKAPAGCPIWSRIPEGERNDDLTCPLSHEQRLVLAKMNLRFLSQYMSFLYGENEEGEEEERENKKKGFYGAIHDHLDSIYNRLLKDDTHIHRLHEFLATLPKVMLKKGYRDFPCPLIITTNYDERLERVFDGVNQEYDLVFYVAEGSEKGHFKHRTPEGKERLIEYGEDYRLPLRKRPIILKLYGTWTDKFVITEEHVINYLFGCSIEQVLPSQLSKIIKRSRILFLGYSLNDSDLQIILHRFWGNQPLKKSRGIKSWIVHQSEPGNLEKRFWQDRQVELIESSLEDLITNLEMGIERLESRLP
jgi:hypothetical protein